MLEFTGEIPLQKISDEFISSSGICLYVLRLDTIHPYISGNKWFKLKYNLAEAHKKRKNTLITFGGAYSNHIVAVAAAGKELGFTTVGIIRGEELSSSDNPVLEFAETCGMKLYFISRSDYKKKLLPHSLSPACSYFLPEGGTNELAVKGCSEIVRHIKISFDYLCCASGTGGTMAGIVRSLMENQKAIGFSVLKGAAFLDEQIKKYVKHKKNWQLIHTYHFGGYAKHSHELLNFISKFEKENDIPIEPVYTAKMFFGIYDMIQKGFFQEGTTVIAIHTGGIFL